MPPRFYMRRFIPPSASMPEADQIEYARALLVVRFLLAGAVTGATKGEGEAETVPVAAIGRIRIGWDRAADINSWACLDWCACWAGG